MRRDGRVQLSVSTARLSPVPQHPRLIRPPSIPARELHRPQTKYLLTEAPLDSPIGPRFLAGAALWLLGWLVNLQADHILINLRKPGETGGWSVGPAGRQP